MNILHLFTVILALGAARASGNLQGCSRLEYDRCVRIADPLIREAHLVFPDNLDDIDLVCRTWNRFVDCLKRYTDTCFTDQQRKQFNKAVENPIESVHQMCMQPRYQKEYLQYAPCIKSTITERSHCGPHYNLLVEQVAQGEIISKATLCCSHDRFKQCVQRETRKLCDRGSQNGPASRFSGQIIDKALSFLADQCFNYIPNSGDCASFPSDNVIPFGEPVSVSTTPSEVFPWSTIQQEDDAERKEVVPPVHITPPRPSTTWLPSSTSEATDQTSYQTDSSTTQVLGSRTRPASYGRSSSWADGPSSSPSSPSSFGGDWRTGGPSTSSPKPDWATMSTWSVVNSRPSTVMEPTSYQGVKENPMGTETWYPAAGNQLSNEVDEPNQQGLSLDKNGAGEFRGFLVPVASLVLLHFF